MMKNISTADTSIDEVHTVDISVDEVTDVGIYDVAICGWYWCSWSSYLLLILVLMKQLSTTDTGIDELSTAAILLVLMK